jgi:hypothetical protein
MSDCKNKKSKGNSRACRKPDKKPGDSAVMIKPREIIPIMAQSSDPLGSYTGTPEGNPGEKPTQDADDL